MAEVSTYVIPLPERIDSGNAAEVEQKLNDVVSAHPGEAPVFDAGNLNYISSAGLRVFMKLRKRLQGPFTVTEVSPEVYDIFETTGFTELLSVKKRLRRISVEGCEIIGRGFYGTVYRLDPDTIVKTYSLDASEAIPMIENEKKMAKKAFLKGIPTAISFDIVKVDGTGSEGDTYGSVFELLKAKSFNNRMEEAASDGEKEGIVKEYVELVKQVHDTLMDPGVLPSAKDRLLERVKGLTEVLGPEQIEKITGMLNALPEDLHVVHGDFHMKNVMLSEGEAMLIDMDTLSTGQPIFDLQGLFITYQAFEEDDENNAMDFLGLSNDTVDLMWRKIIEDYFDDVDAEARKKIEEKISLLGYVSFLYFVVSTPDLKKGELGEKRIRHSKEHIEKLLETVTDLTL